MKSMTQFNCDAQGVDSCTNTKPLIVVADDNPIHLKLLVSVLKGEGYEVIGANNGSECLHVSRQKIPQAVVLDVMMPEQTGFEVCETMRSDPKLSDIPVLFVSAFSDTQHIDEGMSSGGNDYLVKPVSRNVLVSRLNRLINQHERELESERLFSLYEKLVHDQNDMIAELNLDLSIRFANKPFVNLFKGDYSVMGNFLDVVSFSDRKHVEAALSVLEHGESRVQFEFRDQNSGESTWWSWNFRKTTEPESQVVTYLGTGRDVTQQKQMVYELEETKEQIKRADQLKSAFVASMSHGLRTPLNAVVGFTDLILSQGANNDKVPRYLEIVNSNGHQLLDMLNNLIVVMQLEAGTVKVNEVGFNLNKLINKLQNSVRNLVPDDVEFFESMGLDESHANVFSDPVRITQILRQLLMNSIKYTRSGQIELSYRIVHGNIIQFIVKDSGTGIREDILPKLFDSFYQADRKVDGTGLGLSIVRGLTELLGGTVELRTIIGGGTTFYVNIPYKPICPLV